MSNEPTVQDLMNSLMAAIERYERNEVHINAPSGAEPWAEQPIAEPTPQQLARERVLHDFESAFNYLTGGK